MPLMYHTCFFSFTFIEQLIYVPLDFILDSIEDGDKVIFNYVSQTSIAKPKISRHSYLQSYIVIVIGSHYCISYYCRFLKFIELVNPCLINPRLPLQQDVRTNSLHNYGISLVSSFIFTSLMPFQVVMMVMVSSCTFSYWTFVLIHLLMLLPSPPTHPSSPQTPLTHYFL